MPGRDKDRDERVGRERRKRREDKASRNERRRAREANRKLAEREVGRRITSAPVILRRVFIVLVVLLSLVLLLRYLGVPFPWTPQRGEFSVTFFDVGQGDAALIVTKDAAVVVDVGPAAAAQKAADGIARLTDKIDCLIVTHPHEDHMGALSEVLRTVPTDLVIMNSDASDASFFERALDVIEQKDIPVREAEDGALYKFGDLTVELFCPVTGAEDKNENSVVVRASVPGASALVTGDATTDTEAAILSRGADVAADILKVGHHGSSTSSSEEFLDAVNPRIAVISCGAGNSYGHPHDVTLGRLSAIGADVYRTDRDGTVTVSLEDGYLRVKKQG